MNIKDAVKNKLNESLQDAQFRYAVYLACLEQWKDYEDRAITLREAKKVVQILEKEGFGECCVRKNTFSVTPGFIFWSKESEWECDISVNNWTKDGWKVVSQDYRVRLKNTNDYIQDLAGSLNNFEAFFSTYENQERERVELEQRHKEQWEDLKFIGNSFKHYYEDGKKAVQEWNRQEAWKQREKALGIR